jgi:hypothetical protein
MFESLNVPPGNSEVPSDHLTGHGQGSDWQSALRAEFDDWLTSIDASPIADPVEAEDLPDLYSFYEQLALANSETRQSNRRTAEAFGRWAETLARFESQLAPLRETTAQLLAAQPKNQELPRAHCLILIELLDRFYRITDAFSHPPARKSWWAGNATAWRQAWEKQRQGFAILVSHFEELLRKEAVARLEVRGKPFDVALMTAVATADDPQFPPQTVLEEILPGYTRRGELLRTAQVKVNSSPATRAPA